MTTQYNTVNTYSPRGVNFPDGVRVGNFQLPGSQTTSRGISVVEPVVWSIKPFAKQTIFIQAFSTPGTHKLDLANTSYYLSNTDYIYAGNQITLECERVIEIVTDQPCSVKLSGITQYNQKVVCEGTTIASGDFFKLECARGMRALTDVTVITSVANTEVNIETTNKLVLPFAASIPNFLNARYIFSLGGPLQYATLFKCAESSVSPYDLAPNFSLINAVTDEADMLPNSGTPRPIIFNDEENDPVVFDNNGVLTMEFMVNTAGYNPVLKYPNSNNQELTIGIEPYSVGWEG